MAKSVKLISVLAFLPLTLAVASATAPPPEEPVEIVVIVTSDEHGWLQPMVHAGSGMTLGGAANIYSWWVEFEDYTPGTHLLLSGGDNWTGPSISTWFEGEPMVEAFNLMGYDAATVGNHEFDFGRAVLTQRIGEAQYPYLGANILRADTGEPADFVGPYVIEEVNGVCVGVIGLTTMEVPLVSHPANVSDLEFADYAETLEEYVPRMREDGAEVVLLVSHVCLDELAELAPRVSGLVDAMFAGHCHESEAREVEGIPIMGCGWAWRGYARLTIKYNRAARSIEGFRRKLVEVEYPSKGPNPVTPNGELMSLVGDWQERADAALAEEIAYSATGIAHRSWALSNWVTDAWLWAYGNAQVAVTNWGGLRQAVPAGPITVGDIVGVLPFENSIYDVHISGAELAENLACRGGAVGGIRYSTGSGEVQIEFLDGRRFHPDSMYHVLVNDFMYAGGDGYLFGGQDPDAYDTGIHWRQPVIDWARRLGTTPDDPLENHLDPSSRHQ